MALHGGDPASPHNCDTDGTGTVTLAIGCFEVDSREAV